MWKIFVCRVHFIITSVPVHLLLGKPALAAHGLFGKLWYKVAIRTNRKKNCHLVTTCICSSASGAASGKVANIWEAITLTQSISSEKKRHKKFCDGLGGSERVLVSTWVFISSFNIVWTECIPTCSHRKEMDISNDSERALAWDSVDLSTEFCRSERR